MKLALCIVHSRDKNRLSDELVKAGYKFTMLDSTGGFLRESNTTFLVGIEESEQDSLYALVEANCCQREQVVNFMPLEAAPAGALLTSPVKVPVGGAVIFILPVDGFHRC